MSDSFMLPHSAIKLMLPKASNVTQEEWSAFVDRTNTITMDGTTVASYPSAYIERAEGYASAHEGEFMKNWVASQMAARLLPREATVVPLFHQLTRLPPTLDGAKSYLTTPDVKVDSVSGSSENGVDLKALAMRIAATSLEALDGDPTRLALRALADAPEMHTPDELEAINSAILPRYFKRTVLLPAFNDAATAVSATFVTEETPRRIERERDTTKWKLRADRVASSLTVKAPVDSRVSLVFVRSGGNWMEEETMTADIDARGEVTFDLKEASSAQRVLLTVVSDEDGQGPCAPSTTNEVFLPMPSDSLVWSLDNADRVARLKAGLSKDPAAAPAVI